MLNKLAIILIFGTFLSIGARAKAVPATEEEEGKLSIPALAMVPSTLGEDEIKSTQPLVLTPTLEECSKDLQCMKKSYDSPEFVWLPVYGFGWRKFSREEASKYVLRLYNRLYPGSNFRL